MTPQRIQQRRTKGWRKPERTVAVGRNTRFGNPYRLTDLPPGGTDAEDRRIVVELFREMVTDPKARRDAHYPEPGFIRAALRGVDLMCWCPLDQPCHADVLLEIANA